MSASESDSYWPQAITPHVGMAVEGDRRFPRLDLEEEFVSVMTRSNGATLFGLRRIGKSSEAKACERRLREAEKTVVWENAEGKTSEVALLCSILGKLQTHKLGLGDRLLKFISGDAAIPSAVREAIKIFNPNVNDAQAYFAPIAAAIERALLEAQEEVILMIDEFPWVCRSILQADAQTGQRRVDILLAALRSWRAASMRMLLMGSIGLVGLGRAYHLDLNHLNDLTPLSVPPLEPDEAEALIRALAIGGKISGWEEAHTRALLDESVALYPSVLQRGFQQVTISGRVAALDRFPDLFADKVRPDLDSVFFQQFDTRVHRYRDFDAPLPKLLPHLLDLVLAAAAPTPRDRLHAAVGEDIIDADLSDALLILKEDGFVTLRSEKDGSQTWRPASTLVTAWWKQRRGGSRS